MRVNSENKMQEQHKGVSQIFILASQNVFGCNNNYQVSSRKPRVSIILILVSRDWETRKALESPVEAAGYITQRSVDCNHALLPYATPGCLFTRVTFNQIKSRKYQIYERP